MDLQLLLDQVKHNCNISDAQGWGHFSLCGLLMRLRELYLHEHSLNPWDGIAQEELTSWIQEREELWNALEGKDLSPVRAGGESYDPFDVEGLNRLLNREGLVYGCGLGILKKPVLFIARLEDLEEILDYRVYYGGSELCRDLSASPAMLQGRCIYVRHDVIRSILWDRFQILKGRKFAGALGEMFSAYGIEKDEEQGAELYHKIQGMVPVVARLFVLHEVGEAFEDEKAEVWHSFMHEACDKTVELYARSIKDLIADTSGKGPLSSIISGRNEKLLKVYAAMLDGLRREIFPEFMNALQRFIENRDWGLLEDMRICGYDRARKLQNMIMDLWETDRKTEAMLPAIKSFLCSSREGRGA